MAGHSKWHQIRHKKGANDAARGKVFTRHAKLITIAARDGGGDPMANPSLRLVVEKAKADNMPNVNIERAIKKGTGEDKDGTQLFETTYEGYGPAGSAILVQALTDNKNRTLTSVRQGFGKNDGNIGESGSVSWMFERKGVLHLEVSVNEQEEIELLAIDAGAEDIIVDGVDVEILTDPKDIMQIKIALENAGKEVQSAEVTMYAKNKVQIETVEDAQKILKIIEALEDDDDVSAVHSNVSIPADILNQL